ncbi:hypothetical protein ACJ41O_012462 [Fusarium nematophilum]
MNDKYNTDAAFSSPQRSEGGFGFEIVRVGLPVPGPSDILVRLAVTGVCGTDIALASGEVGPTTSILGHEGVGYVVQVGDGVSKDQVTVGDRVGIAWLRDICGVCPFCLHAGGETRCKEQLNSGRKIDGTFAEYAVVPSRYVIHIPKRFDMPDELIAPVLCGGVTAYAALKKSGAVGGQWVAIVGAGGGVGAFAIQYAKAMGYRVIAIDVGDTKRDFCLSSGADQFVDAIKTADHRQAVDAVTLERGADLVLVCSASGRSYGAALDLLAPFGTLVCVGIPPPDQLVSFHPLLFINMGITIVGSAVGTKEDILEALDFVQRGLVKPVIVSKRLEDLPATVSRFSQLTGKVVIRFEDSVIPNKL